MSTFGALETEAFRSDFCLDFVLGNHPSGDILEAEARLLGLEWVEAQLLCPLREGFIQHASVHPFCEYYSRYRQDRELGTKDVLFPHHREIATHLLTASTLSGFDRLLQDLRNAESYQDAVSEAIFASFFSRSGYETEFRSVTKERTSDLFVRISEQLVAAECKRVREYNYHFERARRQSIHTLQRIYKVLRARRPNSSVFVRFSKPPDAKMFDDVVECLKNAPTPSYAAQIYHECPAFSLWLQAEDSEPTTFAEGTLPPGTHPNKSWWWVDRMGNSSLLRDTKLVGFELLVDVVVTTALEKQIRSALGQLPPEGPGLIGIEVPRPRDSSELQLYASVPQALFARGDGSRVNAIYLFWMEDTTFHAVSDDGADVVPQPVTTTMG